MAALRGTSPDCSVLASDYYACYRGYRFVVWKFSAELGISWDLDDRPFKVRRP